MYMTHKSYSFKVICKIIKQTFLKTHPNKVITVDLIRIFVHKVLFSPYFYFIGLLEIITVNRHFLQTFFFGGRGVKLQ